jgi:hypothetical protein
MTVDSGRPTQPYRITVVAQEPLMGILCNVDPRKDGSSLEAVCLIRIEDFKVTGPSGYDPLHFHQ